MDLVTFTPPTRAPIMVAFEAKGLTGAWPGPDWPLWGVELACEIRSARENAEWHHQGRYRSIAAPYLEGQPKPRVMAFAWFRDAGR